MACKREPPKTAVSRAFDECQRSVTVHRRHARLLANCREDFQVEFFPEFQRCLSHALVANKRGAPVQKVLKFVVRFALWLEEGKENSWLDFVAELFRFLILCASSQENLVRTYSTQLIAEILIKFPSDQDLCADTFEDILSCMQSRMEDKVPEVRKMAAIALARLVSCADEEPGEDSTVQLYRQALAIENDKDVRSAILKSMPPMSSTIKDIIRRTSDVEKSVREVAYTQLQCIPITSFSIYQRADLLQRGLTELEPSVGKACSDLLANCWLSRDSQGNVLTLLKYLDVETHETAGELVIMNLRRRKLLEPGELGFRCAFNDESGEGMENSERSEPATFMDAEQSLLWRVLCTEVEAEAEEMRTKAATATGAEAVMIAEAAIKHHELLEKMLPHSVAEFVKLARKYLQAGSEYLFSGRQLFQLATLLDFADATNRKAAASLLHDLLCGEATKQYDDTTSNLELQGYPDISADEKWREVVAQMAVKVHASPAQYVEALTEVVAELALPCRAERPSPAAWLRCLAAVALLLRRAPAVGTLTGRAVEPREMLHWLVLRAAAHGSIAVRQLAVRCLGLYCLLDLTTVQRQLPVLQESLSDVPLVQTEAIKALFDIMIWHGIERIFPMCSEKSPFLSETVPSPAKKNSKESGKTTVEALDNGTNSEVQLEKLLTRLGQFLDMNDQDEAEDDDREFEKPEQTAKEIVALGFAKLLQKNLGQQLILRKLLEAFCSQSLVNHVGLRKCLGAFFRRYGRFARAKEAVCSVFVPIIKESWPGLTGKLGNLKAAAIGRKRATLMASCMLTMLCMPGLPESIPGENDGRGGTGISDKANLGAEAVQGMERLALELSIEVLRWRSQRSAAARGYRLLTCRALASLQLPQLTQHGVKSLLYLLPQIEAAMAREVSILKDLRLLTAQIKSLDSSPMNPLSEGQIHSLIERLESLSPEQVDRSFEAAGDTNTASKSTKAARRMQIPEPSHARPTGRSTAKAEPEVDSASSGEEVGSSPTSQVAATVSSTPSDNDSSCGESRDGKARVNRGRAKLTKPTKANPSRRVNKQGTESRVWDSSDGMAERTALRRTAKSRKPAEEAILTATKVRASTSRLERKSAARRQQALSRDLSESTTEGEDVHGTFVRGQDPIENGKTRQQTCVRHVVDHAEERQPTVASGQICESYFSDLGGHQGEDEATPVKNKQTINAKEGAHFHPCRNFKEVDDSVTRNMTSYGSPAPVTLHPATLGEQSLPAEKSEEGKHREQMESSKATLSSTACAGSDSSGGSDSSRNAAPLNKRSLRLAKAKKGGSLSRRPLQENVRC